MKTDQNETLRLLFQEWQGGYDETAWPGRIYPFGARLMSWLLPADGAAQVEIPVPVWEEGMPAPGDGGVFFQRQLLAQQAEAFRVLEERRPARVVTLGGDCLVSLAPFAWLNDLYQGDMAVVWIDAHPDITTPADFSHAHAMVLGSLLGHGEPAMAATVRRHLTPAQVCYAGVDGVLPHERRFMDEMGLHAVPSADLAEDGSAVLEWIRAGGFRRVAVHWDLDVLDPTLFRSLLFNNPDVPEPIEAEHGKLTVRQVRRLLSDLDEHCDVVGLTLAEYMPWDAWALRGALSGLSILNQGRCARCRGPWADPPAPGPRKRRGRGTVPAPGRAGLLQMRGLLLRTLWYCDKCHNCSMLMGEEAGMSARMSAA